MESEFFWSDLYLKFWETAAYSPSTLTDIGLGILLVLVVLIAGVLVTRRENEGKNFLVTLEILILLPGILIIILFLAPEMANEALPLAIKSAPNTPYKEELRQKAMTVGDVVWVVKRDESGTPTSIDEHIIFAKKSDSILVDESLTGGAHSNNTALPISLVSYPITDCYSDKEDAIAFLETTLED